MRPSQFGRVVCASVRESPGTTWSVPTISKYLVYELPSGRAVPLLHCFHGTFAWPADAVAILYIGEKLTHSVIMWGSTQLSSGTMALIAVIGGTGLDQWPDLRVDEERELTTPWGTPSAPFAVGRAFGAKVVFCARHGRDHRFPPHSINYRANLWALRELGARTVVGVAAVGGIAPWLEPGAVAIPDDIIDYTWGRDHTYSDGPDRPLEHVVFTEPYSPRVRRELMHGAIAAGVDVASGGVMGVTQGPRLESAAEIRRMKRDGCDMVGMTAMPEASLARELGLDYANLAVSVNWAAGIGGNADLHAEIVDSLESSMAKVRALLAKALPCLTAIDEEMR
jgi:5'-methylthioinosine phosphorylase